MEEVKVVRRRHLFGKAHFIFPFPFINISISQPSRLELLKESKSYYEDLRDEIDEEIAAVDKEIGKLAPKTESGD